jgi:hypothetical protein
VLVLLPWGPVLLVPWGPVLLVPWGPVLLVPWGPVRIGHLQYKPFCLSFGELRSVFVRLICLLSVDFGSCCFFILISFVCAPESVFQSVFLYSFCFMPDTECERHSEYRS